MFDRLTAPIILLIIIDDQVLKLGNAQPEVA